MAHKSDSGMKQGGVFKGFGPDNPAYTLERLGRSAGFHRKADISLRGQQLPGGEADAMVAEVDGPGVVFPNSRNLVRTGNFGKTEEAAVGNADGAATVGGG